MMQIFAVSKVCNPNTKSGTETEAAKLILYDNLSQLQTVKNSVPYLFSTNDKQLWITYRTMITNVH